MALTACFLNLTVFPLILENLSFPQAGLLKELLGFPKAMVEGYQKICLAHGGAGLCLQLQWTATLSLS